MMERKESQRERCVYGQRSVAAWLGGFVLLSDSLVSLILLNHPCTVRCTTTVCSFFRTKPFSSCVQQPLVIAIVARSCAVVFPRALA